MANDNPRRLFDGVFDSDSYGMSEWPASTENVGEQLREHQKKFDVDAVQAGNENTDTPTEAQDKQ